MPALTLPVPSVQQPTREDLDRLTFALGGHILFQTLASAVRLGLFTLLERRGPLTREEIARSLGLEDKPARILLLGCATLKLLLIEQGRYSNAPIASSSLCEDSPRRLTSFIEFQHFVNYRPMGHFFEALKSNTNVGLQEFGGSEPTLYQRLAADPGLERTFQAAMQDLTNLANGDLAKALDLRGVRSLLDVGGGNGTNIIELARAWPELNAKVFEFPSVCARARDHIQRAGLQDRLGAMEGNCFTDPFPTGMDCILFCHFFTIWSEERDRLLLRKAYEALPSGGRVALFNMVQTDGEDGPLSAAIGSPYFLTVATGEGMLYTAKEYVEWMQACGFVQITQHVLPQDHRLIVGRKA